MLGEVMEFQLSYLKILKNEAVKVLHSICQQIWKTAVATVLEKVSFYSNPQERQFQRKFNLSCNALISLASKVMFKILKLSFNSTWTENFQMYKLVWGTRDQIANIHWIIEKARESQKTFPSASLTMLKPFTVWTTTNCGKFLRKWEYQITLPVSWKVCM